MHSPTLKLIAVALVSAGFSLSATAQTSTSPGSSGSSSSGATAPGGPATTGTTGTQRRAAGDKAELSRSDRKFMEQAAQDGMAEVELGKLAAQKAQSPEVKQFAERMVQDHTKANQQLMQIAQSKGMTPPTDVDGKHKRLMDKLSKMEPAKFDREYMDQMTDEHKKDVKAFREAAKDAKDPDVKKFASSTLPVLEEHHKTAESIYAKVKDMDRSARSSGAATSASGGARAGATGSSPAGGGTGTGTR